ncbi:MAG: diguanylate cyclase domain-containing protein [Candidatus Dormibacteria bacterium]
MSERVNEPMAGTMGDAVFSLSLDAVVVMDAAGLVVGWNPAANALFGWTAEEATGRAVADVIVPVQYRESHNAGLKKFRDTGQGPVLGQVLDFLTGLRRDGSEFPLEIRISHAGGSGSGARFVAFLRDISARKWAERNQQTRYAVTRAIASRAPWEDLVALVLQSTGEQLGFDRAEAWLVDEGTGTMHLDAAWARDTETTSRLAAESRSGEVRIGDGLLGRSVSERMGLRGDLKKEGEKRAAAARADGLRSMLAVPIEGGDTALGAVGVYRRGEAEAADAVALELLSEVAVQLGQHLERSRFEDALRTAQRKLQVDLQSQASSDPLTGLMNRLAFDDAVAVAVSQGRRQADQFALLMLDLDDFKTVNDTLGHHTGDGLLRETARRLTTIVRSSDRVARLGGDEFAILTGPGMTVEAARALAMKINDAFADPCVVGDTHVKVGASVGVAVFPAHGTDADELVRNADAAMYLAKRTSRGHAMYREGLPAGRGASSPVVTGEF